MGLYEVFFPEVAQADHLATIAETQRRHLGMREEERRQDRRDARELNERVTELENDVGTMALVLAGILRIMENKGIVTREDLKTVLSDLDLLDNIRDGKISVEDIRKGGF